MKALELAILLDSPAVPRLEEQKEAAAELRRLAEVNAELLGALEGFIEEFGDKAVNANVKKSRAAIAKAKEQQ